jgi:hypothetical protein
VWSTNCFCAYIFSGLKENWSNKFLKIYLKIDWNSCWRHFHQIAIPMFLGSLLWYHYLSSVSCKYDILVPVSVPYGVLTPGHKGLYRVATKLLCMPVKSLSLWCTQFSAQILIFPHILLDIIFYVDRVKSLKQSLVAFLGLQLLLGKIEKFHTNMYFHRIIYIVEKPWIVLFTGLLFQWSYTLI